MVVLLFTHHLDVKLGCDADDRGLAVEPPTKVIELVCKSGS